MKPNVGTFDRIMRVIIACMLVAIAAFSDGMGVKLALCIAAWGVFSSGLFGICLLYKIIGINTLPGTATSH